MDTELVHRPQESGWGATIGVAIILIVLAIGAVYFFIQENKRLKTSPVQETINV